MQSQIFANNSQLSKRTLVRAKDEQDERIFRPTTVTQYSIRSIAFRGFNDMSSLPKFQTYKVKAEDLPRILDSKTK